MLLWFSTIVFAQRSKNNGLTISSASTIVNEFTSLTADANTGNTTIQVSNSALNANNRFSSSLAAGDLLFIYQTKGASIIGFFLGTTGNPRDSTMGQVTNYNNTGNFEFAEVKSVPGSTSIELSCPLQKNYTAGTGATQIIRVPRYASLTINSPGVLTTQAWNGTTGGVLVVEVDGNTIINAGGKVDATGLGFRGGSYSNNSAAWTLGNMEGSADSREGADKGEGIAGYQAEYDAISGRYGRGAMANGGGGGCTNNGGGGGGANGGDPSLWNGHGNPDISTANYILAWNKEYAWKSTTTSSGGGKGGYCSATSNQDPTLLGPANSAWGAGYRNNQGGYGGRPLDYSTGKIFLGGGGGAGQGNDTYPGAGGNGGGLIYLMCNGTVSGTGQIVANGNDGGNAQGTPSITAYTGRDGAGGAGAGGTIILYVTGGSASGITAIANGGKGGDLVMVKGAFSGGPSEAEGPGGGGSGGYIALSGGAITQQVSGGNNGLVTGNALSNILNKFPANGATKGGSGSSGQTISTFNIVARDTAICNSGTVTLSVSLAGVIPSGTALTWYDAAVAGNVVGSGTSFTTPLLTSTTTYYVGACPGFYRVPINVNVDGSFSSTLTASNATCSTGGGVTVALTGGTAAFTYTWSNGATSATLTNVPAATYTLTVTDAGGCSTTSTATVNASSAINVNNITPTNLTCFGNSTGVVDISPSGGQTPYTYVWSNGTTGANSISGLSANTYTVTVTDASGCTSTTTATITEPLTIATPTFAITPASCGNSNGAVTATSNGGTGILTYMWSNGATGQTATNLSATTYTLSVTDNNGCSKTNSTTIGNSGGLTTTSSISSSIQCSGGTGAATVTATGGSSPFTFNWSNGIIATTDSLTYQALNLTASTYTVTVLDAGACSSTTTITLTQPTAATISRLSQMKYVAIVMEVL